MNILTATKGIRTLGLTSFGRIPDYGNDDNLIGAFVSLCVPLLKSLDAVFIAYISLGRCGE